MASWGSNGPVEPPTVMARIKEGTRFKRLITATAHISHPIACWRNNTELINGNAETLVRYLSQKSLNVN